MSIRDLFDKKAPYAVVSLTDTVKLGDQVESVDNIKQKYIERKTFIPGVSYENPANFAKFGSAKKYYLDSLTRMYDQYPYDGSLKERTEFLNKSTYLDTYIFSERYPRTNGFIVLGSNGAAWSGASVGFIPLTTPGSEEYVEFIGGPHAAPSQYIQDPISKQFSYANVYNAESNQESNLQMNLTGGASVEFWFKHGTAYAPFGGSPTIVETIVDLVSGSAVLPSRLNINIDRSAATPNLYQFNFSIQSLGAPGVILTTAPTPIGSLENWHHYAFTAINSGSGTELKFYMDGALVQTTFDVDQAVPINYISGTLGALSMETIAGVSKGDAKTSGSFDEFRYWKTKRSSQDIGRYWFTQVGGGANTDPSNVNLGVYYKFNEGITGQRSTDSKVLDYSGRITNGDWIGYPGSAARSIESAMVLSKAAKFEFKDPIIYPFHPAVATLQEKLSVTGSIYDRNNNAGLYTSLPYWIIDEDESGAGNLSDLTQIMASYFDTLYLQIQAVSKIKDMTYDQDYIKPAPFSNKLLESYGLQAPEIFVNADIISQILNRDENLQFDDQLEDIKNLIYKNIYNNLIYIYKSKGTMKSLRNLIHCYGIDEDLIRVNTYGNNVVYTFEDNFRSKSQRKKYIDFNSPDRFSSTIYEQTASGNPNSVSFITGSGFGDFSQEGFSSLTFETEVIFPHKWGKSDPEWFATPFLSSSLFGWHSADPTTPEDFTWPVNDWSMRAYAVRDQLESHNVYFELLAEGPGGTPSFSLTSSLFYDVYENEKWNFAVRVSPDKVGGDLVSGTLGATETTFQVEFYGVNSEVDVVANEFYISTGSLNLLAGGHLVQPKRIYAGSHHTNFTGSIIDFTDVKLSSVRYWASYLNNDVIKAHARDAANFGTHQPYKSTYLYLTDLADIQIPQMETLALQWDFNNVSSSGDGLVPNAPDAGFAVQDLSSGSLTDLAAYTAGNPDGNFGGIIHLQHTGRGDFFRANDPKVVDLRFVYSGKQVIPEVVQSADMIDILSTDDIVFTKDSRPIDYYFQIEKSMYQTISDEMLNIFATIVDFNNLIGDPVNRYRLKYKRMEKLRQLFFKRVQNTPKLNEYIKFYEWIDGSLNIMLQQLLPASANFSDNIRNMVEGHILERNKYDNKFPTLEMIPADPETGLRGINELLYNWKFGHAPNGNIGIPSPQNENCFWWKERASRQRPGLASPDSAVNFDKNQYLSASLQVLERSYTTPYRMDINRSRQIQGGYNRPKNQKRDFVRSAISFGTSDGLQLFDLPGNSNDNIKDCVDDLALRSNTPYYGMGIRAIPEVEYQTNKLSLFAPLTLTKVLPDTQAVITNYHEDTYGDDYEVPAQGPFTDYAVGGNQYRHVPLNDGTDNVTNRMEGFQVAPLPGGTALLHPEVHNPRGVYYRDEIAKRPVNIRNIHHRTGSTILGNYDHIYDVVQTCGRYTNNRAFVKAGGFNIAPPLSYSDWVLDIAAIQYAEVQRGRTPHVFVNRFSSPGGPETAGDSNGGPGLDRYSAEFSAYNNLNYRNSTVRKFLQLFQTSHVGQFGYYTNSQHINGLSGSVVNSFNYNGTGSIYQVNRNPVSRRLNETTMVSGTSTFSLSCSAFDASAVNPSPNTGPGCNPVADYLSLDRYNFPGQFASIPTYHFNFATQNFTISVWVKTTHTIIGGGQTDYIISNAVHGPAPAPIKHWKWAIFARPDGTDPLKSRIYGTVGGAGVSPLTITTITSPTIQINDGEWHHCLLTKGASGGGNFDFYVDGIHLGTAGMDDITGGASSSPIFIGSVAEYDNTAGACNSVYRPCTSVSIPPNTGGGFSGFIDDVTIWETDFSADEVLALYIRPVTPGCTGPPVAAPGNIFEIVWPGPTNPMGNLLGYYLMGDGSTDIPGNIKNYAGGLEPNLPVLPSAEGINIGIVVAEQQPVACISYTQPTGCKKIYDNYYIQHAIPQTDCQYTWTTASILDCQGDVCTTGYWPYSGMEGNAPAVNFVSSSAFKVVYASGGSEDDWYSANEKKSWGSSSADPITALTPFIAIPNNDLGVPPFGSPTPYPPGCNPSNFTVSAWFKIHQNQLPTAGTDPVVIMSRWKSDGGITDFQNSDWRLGVERHGLLQFDIIDGPTLSMRTVLSPNNPIGTSGIPAGSWADDKWHNVIASLDTRAFGLTCRWSMRIWVDGIITNGLNPAGGQTRAASNDGRVVIGAQFDSFAGGGPYGEGVINAWPIGNLDEISWWSQDFILPFANTYAVDLYNEGCPTDLTTHAAAPTLVSWYRMGDAPGDGGMNGDPIYDVIGPNDGININNDCVDFLRPGEVPGTVCSCSIPTTFYQDFAGINSIIVDTVYPEMALLSSSGNSYQNTDFAYLCPQNSPSPDELHALLLHRDGPGGWPTWKQIRGKDNALTRYYNNHNLITCNRTPGITRTVLRPPPASVRFVRDRFAPLKIFKEPALTSDSAILRHTLGCRTINAGEDNRTKPFTTMHPITVKHSFGNNLELFTSTQLNECAEVGKCDFQAYDTITKWYLNGQLEQNSLPIYSFIEMRYQEKIFPAANNSFLKQNRERIGYKNGYWRDNRRDRSKLGETKWGEETICH